MGGGAGAARDTFTGKTMDRPGWNRLPAGGPIAVPGAYLESVGTRG